MAIGIIEFLSLAQKGFQCIDLLRQLFSDGTVTEVFREIAGTKWKAAARSLSAARLSNKPEYEIRTAVSHIREAALFFLGAAARRRFWGILPSRLSTRVAGYESAIKSYLILALCYGYLGEKRNADDELKQVEAILPLYRDALLSKAEHDFKVRGAGIGGASAAGVSVMDDLDDFDKDYRREISIAESKTESIRTAIATMYGRLKEETD